MAKKVLIPVDFSMYSNKAIEMACGLSHLSHHDIDLVHVFTDSSDIYKSSLEDNNLIDPRVGSAKKEMQKLVATIVEAHPEINVTVLFKDGDLYNEIKKITSQQAYDAIIMGTKGASGLEALLTGSNMFEVFQNSKTPVLAVPYSEKQYRANKIGLLVNFKDGEIAALNQAINLLGNDFELLLVHINADNVDLAILDEKFESFIKRIIDETKLQRTESIFYAIKNKSFFLKYKERLTESIESIITDEEIDILLVTKSKKSLYRQIVEENVVKRMAHRIKIPKFFAKSP